MRNNREGIHGGLGPAEEKVLHHRYAPYSESEGRKPCDHPNKRDRYRKNPSQNPKPFDNRSLHQTGNGRGCLSRISTIYKSTSHLVVTHWRLFPSGQEQAKAIGSHSSHVTLNQSFRRAEEAENEARAIQMGKQKWNCLFAGDMISHIENPKVSAKENKTARAYQRAHRGCTARDQGTSAVSAPATGVRKMKLRRQFHLHDQKPLRNKLTKRSVWLVYLKTPCWKI